MAQKPFAIEEHRAGIDMSFIRRTNANVGGFAGLVRELLRNTDGHAHAKRVWLNVVLDPLRIELIDDGIGFGHAGRGVYGGVYGKSTARGSGQGARGAIFDNANKFTVYTCPANQPSSEPVKVYVIERTEDQFFSDMTERKMFSWDVFLRDGYDQFPNDIISGTKIVVTDFVNPSTFPGIEEFRKMVADNIRLLRSLRVWVNGKKLEPPPIDGEKVFKASGLVCGKLANIDIEVVIPKDHREHLWIGHSTPLLTLNQFFGELKHGNPSLYRQVPSVYFETHLAGFIKIPALEEFQNQDQRSLRHTFYYSELCREIVTSLLTDQMSVFVSNELENYRRTYGNAELEMAFVRVSEMFREIYGDPRSSVHNKNKNFPKDSIDSVEVIRVSPSRVTMGLGDEREFKVVDPVDGYIYRWTDNRAGILLQNEGPVVRIRSPEVKGDYILTVFVEGHPEILPANIGIKVATPLEFDPSKWRRKNFRLSTPQIIEIGSHDNQECRVEVRHVGETSGEYVWSVTGPIKILEETNMSVKIGHVGDVGIGVVTCKDKACPEVFSETCIVNVIKVADEELDKKPNDVLPKGHRLGNIFSFEGEVYRFVGIEARNEMWDFDAAQNIIFISQGHPAFVTENRERFDMLILTIVVHCHVANLVKRGKIPDESTEILSALSQKLGLIFTINSTSGSSV